MAVNLTISGEGISFERELPVGEAPRVMDIAVNEEADDGGLSLTMSGEGISFERSISQSAGVQIIEAALLNDDGSSGEDSKGPAGDDLPESFFNRLTSRQEAFVRILLKADDWMLNEDIRQKMEEEYGLSSKGGQAIAGILSGFTRKYGKDFRKGLVDARWTGDQVKYRLNRDSGWEDELRAGLDD